MADLNQSIQPNSAAYNGAPGPEERTAAAEAVRAEASINNSQRSGNQASGQAVPGSLQVQYSRTKNAIGRPMPTPRRGK